MIAISALNIVFLNTIPSLVLPVDKKWIVFFKDEIRALHGPKDNLLLNILVFHINTDIYGFQFDEI